MLIAFYILIALMFISHLCLFIGAIKNDITDTTPTAFGGLLAILVYFGLVILFLLYLGSLL